MEADPTSFLSRLVEVLHGLFPSVGGALQALARSSPRRLQENLFGGKFLKNAASFNFSGAVGARGALGLVRLSSQSVSASLQKHRDLVRSVSGALEDPAFLSALQHTLRGISSSQSLDQVSLPPTPDQRNKNTPDNQTLRDLLLLIDLFALCCVVRKVNSSQTSKTTDDN